jgi:hypothetical protein
MHPLTVDARLRALESDVHQLQHANTTHAETHALVDAKLDDLSGDLRALTHEVRTEVVPRLDRIEADIAEIKTDIAGTNTRLERLEAGVSALLAHFQITPPTT